MNMKSFGKPVLVGGLVGIVMAIGFLSGAVDSWSARASDRLFIGHATDPAITIITIDDGSIAQLGRWPWNRSIHAAIIDKLAAAGAKVIAYDVNFPEVSDATNDSALAASIEKARTVVLPVELELQRGPAGITFNAAKTLAPLPIFAGAAAATGHSNTPPDLDGIVRRVPLAANSPAADNSVVPSFVAEIARLAGTNSRLKEAPLDAYDQLLVDFAGAPFANFTMIPAADVVHGTADLSRIKNGVVFVGSTASDLHDSLLVPTSGGVPMSGVEIHASTYDTIAGRHWLQPVPRFATALLLILLGLLIGLLVAAFRLRFNLPLTIILWIGVAFLSLFAFEKGYIAELIWPTFSIVFSYAAVTIERRRNADRIRRELKSAFSRYVSPSVVDHIMQDQSKLKLGGDRRTMSVLFSDIRGFTTISEGMTPDHLVGILNTYLSRMTDLVFKHEGVLDKYIGDAVMAFWNAPLDQADHALRAVTTAIDMREALAEMNENKEFGDVQLHIGLGINSGDMIVGNVGGSTRFDYTVIGDNVNLASRLEGLTKEYGIQILISESTRHLLGDAVITRKLDKVAVKGKKEPVVIYEVMDVKEGITQASLDLAHHFESALEKYFARDFIGAIVLCDTILRDTPADGPAKTLRERAQHFKENPPQTGWDGTWVYTKK